MTGWPPGWRMQRSSCARTRWGGRSILSLLTEDTDWSARWPRASASPPRGWAPPAAAEPGAGVMYQGRNLATISGWTHCACSASQIAGDYVRWSGPRAG